MSTKTITASVAGYARHGDVSGMTWADLWGAAGNASTASECRLGIWADSATDKYEVIERAISIFDTSALDGYTVISAILRVTSPNALNLFGGDDPTINIYSASPASTSGIANGDYDSLGTTAYCDTDGTYNTWASVPATYDFTFNAIGIAAINTSGFTSMGFRTANYDAINTSPTWSNDYLYFAFASSTTKPQLIVTYSKTTTDRVTGIVHRLGPGYYTQELHLGGLSTSWRLVDLQKAPTPAVPAEITSAPPVGSPVFFIPDFHDPEGGGTWYQIIDGVFVPVSSPDWAF